MSLEGAIHLDVSWDGRCIDALSLRSTRPRGTAGVLAGRTVAELPRLITALFSICRRAHTLACELALDAARGDVPSAEGLRVAERGALVESLQETLWRLLLDWPRLDADTPEVAVFAELRRRLAATAGADARGHADVARHVGDLLQQRVFGLPPGRWLDELDHGGFDRWLAAGETPTARRLGRLAAADVGGAAARLLPKLDAARLAGELAPRLASEPDFARLPTWRGAPAETGPLARHAGLAALSRLRQCAGDTVGLRLAARLVDAALGCLRLSALAGDAADEEGPCTVALGPGAGCAAVETARGTLVHRIVVEGERVAAYQLLAPTEWNFHPRGALADLLLGHAAADAAAAERAARLAVHALDPCVPHTVTVISHA